MNKNNKRINRSRVFIVIPTLGDRPELLRETLESLTKQSPTRPDIIVVCPVNQAETRRMAVAIGATIIDDPTSPRGISAAVNAGFENAKPWHEYGAWMGDDDLLEPKTLAATISALDNNPKAVVAFGHCNYIDDRGRLLFTNKAGKLAPWLMTWGPDLVPIPGALFRMSAIKEVGKFDTSLKFAMDLDMFLRLRKIGKFVSVGHVVGSFRWHPDSTTVANRAPSTFEAKMVKRRYLSSYLLPLAPLWEVPVKIAAHFAAQRVNKLAQH